MDVQKKTTSSRNRDFNDARRAKRDEFYTQLPDIEAELRHYEKYFRGKVVYLNCDDPKSSNFFRFFSDNFERLRLKRLVATCYKSADPDDFSKLDSHHAVRLEYIGKGKNRAQSLDIENMEGDGDFRSEESIEFLKQADVVVTNPPFSLFREYVAQLFEYDKKFLILGNMNALTYKEIFPLFLQNKIWYGPSIRSGDREFAVPDDYPVTAAGFRVGEDGTKFIRVKGVRWFTNLDYPERYSELQLNRTYNSVDYPEYANFDAIEVGRTADIPCDYAGLMGVPISFMDKYNPEQFEIVGSSRTLGTPMSQIAAKGTYQEGGPRFYLPIEKGKYRRMYERIVIRSRKL